MKRGMLSIIAAILVTSGLLFYVQPPKAVKAADAIIIDPHQTYQTVDGWGTSLAWWANIVGNWSSSTIKEELMDDLFSVTDGIGLNLVRYNIGGGINASLEVDYRVGADIPSYQPLPNQWDWNADSGQRWVLREAFQRDVTLAEAFSNSPPHWMTIAQCASGSTTGGDNLDPNYYDAFAEYLAEVVAFIQTEDDVMFHSLSPFNEPMSPWWVCGNNQEGSHFDLATQEIIIDKVHQALQALNLEIAISGPEEYSVQQTKDSFEAYSNYTKSLVGQINTHAYDPHGRESLRLLADNHGKDLWMSEVSIGGSVGYAPLDMDAGALNLSNQILQDMKYMQPQVWTYWQAVEDRDRAQLYDHSHGLIHAPFTGTEDYSLSKQFYAMGQYSKFIRPGHHIIGAYDDHTLASYDEANDKLVIVTTNDSSNSRDIFFDLSRFSQVTGDAIPYRTSNLESLSSLSAIPASTSGFNVTVPAKSIMTFVLDDVLPGNPLTPTFDPNAYYEITNRNSGQLLDVNSSSTQDGAHVIQWPHNGGSNQQWKFTATPDGYYIIKNRNSGKVLDVFEGSVNPAANVIQWNEHGHDNQLWRVIDTGNGYYYLENKNSQLMLDVNGASTSNGESVIQWNFNGGHNQQWSIIETN